MKSDPPALAMWLLKRLGSGTDADAIAGDLLERFQERRSTWWYWRQVIVALVVGPWQEIRTHKLRAARAVCIGAVACFLLQQAVLILGGLLIPSRLWTSAAFRFGVAFPAICAPAILTGWIVGRLHRPHGLPQVFAFLFCWLAWSAPRIGSLAVNSLDHERYVPYLVGAIEWTTLTALCIAFGGFLSIGKPSGETKTEAAEP
jgi:hypothetical protein